MGEFEGTYYDRVNPFYKFIGYFGLSMYLIIFAMIFLGRYFSEMERQFHWFKAIVLSTLLLSVISYIVHIITPKYGLMETIEPLGKLVINQEFIRIGTKTIEKSEVLYIEFIGHNFPQITGGRYVVYSSDGSNNKILIRTDNQELSTKFQIPSEIEFKKLVEIAKKWKSDGVHLKASFDLK